ncbi:MAG: hypothetical protein RJA22_1563 [Verrucomicrobiota bacterium]|jgi:hypothetical protein
MKPQANSRLTPSASAEAGPAAQPAGKTGALRRLAAGLACLAHLAGLPLPAAGDIDIDAAPHHYSTRTPSDRFTQLIPRLEAGTLLPEGADPGEKAVLKRLLQTLGIPASSQLLVFSTTSLQLSLISPANPRALYFTDDLYLGYIPGGRIELVSLDPELGAIFYIFDLPRPGAPRPPRVERSGRCMNCHAGEDTGHVPGLLVKSVIPGPSGGSLTAYRSGRHGHDIPFADRFGGWHVTGQHGITQHWGNLTGRLQAGQLTTLSNLPGARFRFDRYPAATSDILAHLLHEHQAGFVNHTVAASYQARSLLHAAGSSASPSLDAALDALAEPLVRYLLFADETPLPPGGVEGDPAFREDFLRSRRPVQGRSLRDLDLKTRLLRHRCSYMIYSPVFTGLPARFKQRLYQRLDRALASRPGAADPVFAYLPPDEKQAIRTILKATLTDLPPGW